MKKGLLLVSAFAILSSISFAQSKDEKKAAKQGKQTTQKTGKQKYNFFSIGAHGGHTIFYGDVRQYDWWLTDNAAERWNFAGGGYVNYQLNPVFGFNINVIAGSMGGIKRLVANTPAGNSSIPSTEHTNVKFTTNFVDYTFNTSFNFVNLMYSDRTKQRKFTAYITAGIGLISFRTKKTGLYSDLPVGPGQGYVNGQTETKAMTNETVFPVGAGVKFRLSRRFDIGLEYTHRLTLSDKLDATFGNTGSKDSYSYASLNVAFKFGKQKDSKEWVNPYEALNKNLNDIQANLDGLAQDADGDGVSDLFDKEPGTPADVAVDGSGRALDTDGDGVPDHLDGDPFTNRGARVDENGKELDSDGDGVADSQDLEPNTPKGNLVNFQGKTISLEALGGDKKSTSTVSGTTLMSVYFKVNSSRIDYWSSFDKLAEVAKLMKSNTGVKVKVIGHADKTGAEDYNKSLAEKRAQSAVDHLVKVYGIDAGRFTIASEGESKPLSSAEEALNVNRRVDFVAQ